MTEAEFLADLQTKVLYMGGVSMLDNANPSASTLHKKVDIVELGLRGTAKPMRSYQYTVVNAGKVAGPQFYEADVRDENGNIVHAAGDPILDSDGNQVTLSAFEAENAYPAQPIDLPVGDALLAVQYLESLKANGTVNAYEYESGRSDLGHFFAKVWVENQDGTESEQRIRVSYDAQGNPSHKVVV